MKSIKIRYIAFVVFFLSCALPSIHAHGDEYRVDLPILNGFCNDYATVLSVTEAGDCERVLSEYEKEARAQIIVLIMKDTGIVTAEGFANRVWERNRIGFGEKYQNRAALILLVINSGEIVVKIPDKLRNQVSPYVVDEVIRTVIKPQLEKKQYFTAVTEASIAVRKMLLNPESYKPPTKFSASAIIITAFITLFIIGILFVVVRRRGASKES